MLPFFIPSIHYHADDSAEVHNSNITTQSKIPLFVFKHLVSYTVAGYDKTCQKQLSVCPFFASQYTHMCSKNNSPAHFCAHVHTKRCIIAKKESKQAQYASKKTVSNLVPFPFVPSYRSIVHVPSIV